MRNKFVGVLAAAALSAVAACTSSTQSAPEPVPVPTPSTSRELQLPIDAYALSPAQRILLAKVRSVLMRDCVRRFGFDFADKDPQKTALLTEDMFADAAMSLRYGLADISNARKYGYRPAPGSIGRGMPPGLTGRKISELSAAERLVLQGPDADSADSPSIGGEAIPKGGCQGEVDRVTSAAASNTNAVGGMVSQIRREGFIQSENDQRVIDVFQKWSQCMAEDGYRYSGPFGPMEDERWAREGNFNPSKAEIATAVKDVTCKHRTNLIGIWFAVESEYQNAAIAAHEADFIELREALSGQIDKIEDIYAKQTS